VAHRPTAFVRDPETPGSHWWHFESPLAVLQVDQLTEVLPAIATVEDAVQRGHYAVGYLAYESAPAFDSAFSTSESCPLPLLWFGIFDPPKPGDPFQAREHPSLPLDWSSSVTREVHAAAVASIREAIADGSTYQVNLTYRLRARFEEDPQQLFTQLYHAQPTAHAAYVDTGRHVLASASPELFFQRQGKRVVSRPMKGTAPRGRYAEEDAARSESLACSEKDRSENLMIVDMVRNDLGRIAKPGTVRVPRLFDVERYDTVLQMVSEVDAQCDRSIVDILTALFPAASITGAPKVSTMRWIQRLEKEPRGIYTGAIGVISPGERAHFNVAIRTAHIDRETRCVEYGTGGGIVWDSDSKSEWAETRTKARILVPRVRRFRLLETIRWSPGAGFHLLDFHIERLAATAAYFDYPFHETSIRGSLDDRAAAWTTHANEPDSKVVRLLLEDAGSIRVEARDLEPTGAPWRVGIATNPVDSSDRFLFHKTTKRDVYDEALESCPGCDDALLRNERGEWTESTRANLVAEVDGVAYTPPRDCGLLAGTERRRMLAEGTLVERILHDEALMAADEIYLVNSVRGRIEVDQAFLNELLEDSNGSRSGEL